MIVDATMDDHDLLREYTEQGSEKAFSDLVERYLPLVYGTAYRIVRDAHTAQDVAQSVFLQLARKAWTLREARALPGWLYRCTQRAAFMAIRSEQRRTRRETEAMNLAEQNQTPAMAWEQISPLLDEALSHLSRIEQDAVILRFFQEKSYREVGVMCGLNENAARKRVERSLDKIRVHFASRGLTATAALLGTVLAAHASEPPPLGLATRVAQSAAGNAAKVGGLSYFVSQIFLYLTNFKVLASVVVVAGLAAFPLLFQHNETTQMRADLAASTQQVAQLRRNLATVNQRLDEATATAAGNAEAVVTAKAKIAELSTQIAKETSALPGLSALDRINFVALDAKTFTLKPDAIDRLKITPDEGRAVQQAIDQLRARVQAHALATVQQLPVDTLQGPNIVRFFKNHPGNQSLYLIPPMSKDEKDALVNPFAESVKGILGQERGDLLLQRSADNIDKWMTSGQGTVVAFADINGNADSNLPVDGSSQGQKPTTAWLLKRTLRDGSFAFTRGQGTAAVPAQLSYLFEPVPDDATVVAPAYDSQN